MPLKRLPYKRLQQLIGMHLFTKEDPQTQELIEELAHVRKKRNLTKPELIKICRWKSPRAIRYIASNREKRIMKITKAAFAARSERDKLALLTDLNGVSVPMASAILTLTNPKRYGVIDIRVWQLLFKMGTVGTNKGGANFNFKQWYRFLRILRYYAKMYAVGARDVERTLFRVHQKYQSGNLYKQ